jgi:hypothetical protein
MSNANFDLLWKQCELQNAKDMLRMAQESLGRPDLTESDVSFLNRTVAAATMRIAAAKANLRSLR